MTFSRTPLCCLTINSFQKSNHLLAFHTFFHVSYGVSGLTNIVKDDSFLLIKYNGVHSAARRPVNINAASTFFCVVENAVAFVILKLSVAFLAEFDEEAFAEPSIY